MAGSSDESHMVRSLDLVSRRGTRLVLLAAATVGLSGFFSSMAETPPAAETGIEGAIFVSPSRPGPSRIGVRDIAPAPNVRFVVKKEDSTVASFTTDAE